MFDLLWTLLSLSYFLNLVHQTPVDNASAQNAALCLNTNKIGTVPHEVIVPDKEEPVVDYQQRLDYSHLVDTIQSLLKKYEGTRLFIYKEHESAAIGSSCIEFDVFYVLIAPDGEEPAKCLRFKGIQGTPVKYDSFAPLSLDWVNVGSSKTRMVSTRPLLRTVTAYSLCKTKAALSATLMTKPKPVSRV